MTTITFKRPFDLRTIERQGAIAFLEIYAGKLIGGSSTAPASASKGKEKTTAKQFKKMQAVNYRYLASCTIHDKTKSLDTATFTFANPPLSVQEDILSTFLEGEYIQVVWGVRGAWHFRRVMKVRRVKHDASTQMTITITADGTGARLQEGQSTATYNARRITDIAKSIGRSAGMRVVSDLRNDATIQHLSAARRSPLEVLYQLGDKYGFYVSVVNNVIYLNEINDGQPVRRYNYGGPRANILQYTAESTIAGIEGAKTKAKNREDNSQTQGSKSSGVNKSLQINYKDTGKGYSTRVVTKSNAKPTTQRSRDTANTQSRTHHTLKTGKLVQRVVRGANVKRVLRTKKATLVLINEPLTPNVNILIEGLATKYSGRYCTHDIKFAWSGGFWKVTANISRASTTKKPGTRSKKGSKSPQSKKRLASPNPKLVVTYKRNGTYTTSVKGKGYGTRAKDK